MEEETTMLRLNPRFRTRLTAAAIPLLLALTALPAAADDAAPKARRTTARAGDDEKDVRRDVLIERMKIPHGELLRAPRGFLGVELLPLNPALRTHFGVPEDSGALVASVVEGSPADKAGIKVGDILTRVDGEAIEGPHDLREQIREAEDGQSAAIELYRDGKAQTVTATLERRERSELDLAPMFIRDGGPGDRMVLRLDPEKMGKKLEDFEIAMPAPGDHPRIINLRQREAELEKRLAELEKRIQELEKQLQK
jgi:hypothetical protein